MEEQHIGIHLLEGVLTLKEALGLEQAAPSATCEVISLEELEDVDRAMAGLDLSLRLGCAPGQPRS